MVAEGIRKLRIRGAPAIGIAAAMGIALAAQEISARDYSRFVEALHPVFEEMLSTRPTAVNIFWAVERVKKFLQRNRDNHVLRLKDMLVREAQASLDEDIAVNKAIGRYGAPFIADGDTLITHCDAGAIATAGYGTAEGVMRAAVAQGKDIHVFIAETRPVLQGARLTVWEARRDGLPVTLLPDSAAGSLLGGGGVDGVLVGADRIAADGSVVNKVGSYPLAVLAARHRVPFISAAPTSTFDLDCPSGPAIVIEQRGADEVRRLGGRAVTDPEVPVFNPAFDLTPPELLTAIVSERGIARPVTAATVREVAG